MYVQTSFLRILAVPLLMVSALHAQNASSAIPRKVRFLTVGSYPPPVFDTRGGDMIEVDPPDRLIPPQRIKLKQDEGAARAPATPPKPTPESVLRFNQIIQMPPYSYPANIRLSLERKTPERNLEREITCNLGNLVEPLVLIYADPQRGWDQPQVRVMDFSGQSFPSGATYVFNLTPFNIGAQIENTKVVLPPEQKKLIKDAAIEGKSFRYRVDAASGSLVAPIANSSCQLGPQERLLIVAVPDSTIKGRPPITLRTITDSL